MNRSLAPSERSLRRLDQWSKWTLIVTLFLLPVVLYFASGIKIGSASAHAWLPEGRAERQRYEEFVRAFGNDQFLVVSWDGCRVDDPRLMSFQSLVANAQDQSPALVAGIQSSKDSLELLMKEPLGLSQAAAMNRLRGVLFGPDETALSIISFTPRGIASQKASVELVRSIADQVEGLGRDRLRMVGSIYEAFAVDEAAEGSLKRLVLPSSLLGVLLAWLCLRSVRGAAAVLIIAGVGQLLAVALVSATGGEFSAVLIVLPTLVFMLTLSAAVHFMNYYADVAAWHRDHFGSRAIYLGIKPSILATVTTALGMIALATSQLAPVRGFGLYSATALCLATTFLILAFPRISDLFCAKRFAAMPMQDATSSESHHEAMIPAWATNYAAWSSRNSTWIVFLGFALIGLSFYGLLHLKSSTKFDDMFPQGSSTIRDMKWVEQHLGPIASVEVLVKFNPDVEVGDYEQLEWIDRIVERLKNHPDVGGVIGATSFLPKLPKSSSMRDVTRRSVLRKELPKSFGLLEEKGWISNKLGQRVWRINAKVSALSRADYGELTSRVRMAVEQVRDSSEKEKPFQADLTGLSPIMHDTNLALLDDLGSSFTTAFFLITPVMMWIGRGIRAGLLIMIPTSSPKPWSLAGWPGSVTPSISRGF